MTRTLTSTADQVSTEVLWRRAFQGLPCWLGSGDGERVRLPLERWMGGPAASAADRAADEEMLSDCSGPTLDLGCGPGRLTALLTERGVRALGVDLSPTAVEMTISRGADALRRNIFAPLPGLGQWRHVLLADGNIGIAGDPLRVLRRAAALLAPGGVVIAEVEPPTSTSGIRVEQVRWETEALQGHWFDWARVGLDAVPTLAAQAGLRVESAGECDRRVFVRLRSPGGED